MSAVLPFAVWLQHQAINRYNVTVTEFIPRVVFQFQGIREWMLQFLGTGEWCRWCCYVPVIT